MIKYDLMTDEVWVKESVLKIYVIIHATTPDTFTQEKTSGGWEVFLCFQQQGDININVSLVQAFFRYFSWSQTRWSSIMNTAVPGHMVPWWKKMTWHQCCDDTLGLTLYMLDYSEGTWTYIYILCHSSKLIWHRYLKSILKQDQDLHILHSQYHGCWCPCEVRSQGISSHDIDLDKPS